MYRIIRFNKEDLNKYKESINVLLNQGYFIPNAKPYIGFIDGDKVIACIWKDRYNEISYVTDKEYRRQGLMKELLEYLINMVFKNRLNFISAKPMNKASKKLLRKVGFWPEQEDIGVLYEFYIH